MSVTPTDHQNQALNAIVDWYKNGHKPFFYLGGYAGSGKTTLARLAVEACGLDPDRKSHVLYATFTGKAAMVLQKKGCKGASTVHHLIYKYLKTEDGELHFGLNRDSDLQNTKLLVLDECSMINDEVANDLLSFGTKILVLGDPGQLEPVKGTGYFTEGTPDFFLKEIHRQALENPIIWHSQEVRRGKEIPFGDFGNLKKVHLEDVTDAEFRNTDQILTGTHRSRHELNTHLLELEGFPITYPLLPGIKLICMKNYYNIGALNGMIARTTEMVTHDDIDETNRWLMQSLHIEEGPKPGTYEIENHRIHLGMFEDNWSPRSDDRKKEDEYLLDVINTAAWELDDDSIRVHLWDFGYAITVHKSQGSQWDSVLLYDDNMLSWNPISRRKWLYTALTRSSEDYIIAV